MNSIPKRILAATDFSPTAAKATAFASSLARSFEAHLHVLHAAILLEDPHLESHRRSQLNELLSSTDDARRTVLEESYEAEHGIDITPHLVRGIAPGEVIVESSGTLGCDLIVMGTHGRRGISHLFLGSVAERVVRTSVAPVITVRGDAVIDPDGISKILVPHDFSDASSDAIRRASEWATALEASLTLLHVVEPLVYPEFYALDLSSDDIMDRLTERSSNALEGAAQELTGVDVDVVVKTGNAAETIVDIADSGEFGLVVMATRGLSGLEHVLLGSVAEAVLRRCRAPLLSIPSQ
jgi:nucleotide-binding universal stress UspA family protein